MQNAYFPIIFDLRKKVVDEQDEEPTALSSLSEADWQLLSRNSTLRTFQAGEVILEKDELPDAIYIIEKGEVRIERKPGEIIARRGPGAVFGEISFLEGKGTSASVVADGTVDVSVISRDYVESLLDSAPEFAIRFYKTLAVMMAYRLRQAANRINQLS